MSFDHPPMDSLAGYDTRVEPDADSEPDWQARHDRLCQTDTVYRSVSFAYGALVLLDAPHHEDLRMALAEAMAQWGE